MPGRISWVFGLQNDPNHRDSWMHVLFSRLTGDFTSILRGERTRQAEEGLFGGRAYAYYFVDTGVPHYGFLAIAHDPPHDVDARVLPFDSGGLWHDYVRTFPPLDGPGKLNLVARSEMTAARYTQEFEDWRALAFNSPAEYAKHVAPVVPRVPEIEFRGDEYHSWLWEGRVDRAAHAVPPCVPVMVLMDAETATSYADWVELRAPTDGDSRMAHLGDFTRMLVISDDPLGDLTSLLSTGEGLRS